MSSGASSGISNGTSGAQGNMEQMNSENAALQNESNLSSTMPNHSQAVTPKEKFTKYSLDYDNPNARGKAEAYEKGLGYTKENADSLIQQISDAVTTTAKPYSVSQTQFGIKYKYRIPVTGPNGKKKNVIAVYQIDSGYSIPRLITNYLEGK